MFSLGVAMITFGWAAMYAGVANVVNGGNGPTLRESLGLKTAIAPPGANAPNLTGQPPSGTSVQ